MQSIETFFDAKATSFCAGRTRETCAGLVVPTTIYFGDDILFVSNAAQLADMMATYFEKLKARGRVKTRCNVTSKAPLSNGGIRVTVAWSHMDQAGDAIRSFDITYYCKARHGAWEIALMEVGATSNGLRPSAALN